MPKRIILITGIFLTIFAIAGTVSAQSFSFGLRPENAESGYFQYTLSPGETFSDAVLAINSTDEDILLDISVVAGHTSLMGGITFPGIADGPAEWINLENEGIIEIPAQQQVRLPFSLTIPDNTPAGEYVAGFLATPASSSEAQLMQDSIGIKLVSQMGLTMVIEVPGPSLCEISIESISTEIHKGNMRVVIHMHNTGNIHFKGMGAFSLRTDNGSTPLLLQDMNIGYFVAGDSMHYPLILEDVPAARMYDAEVTVMGTDCDFQTLYSQPLTISDTDLLAALTETERWARAQQVNAPLQSTASNGGPLQDIGLLLLGLAVVLLIGVVIVLLVIKSHRSDEPQVQQKKRPINQSIQPPDFEE